MKTRPGPHADALAAALRIALVALAVAGCCCPALPPAGLLATLARAEITAPPAPAPQLGPMEPQP